MVIAVNEIVKNPSLVSNPKEITYVEDKRSKKLKSIIIPAKYKDEFEEFLKEKKFKEWIEKNRGLLEMEHPDFLDDVVEDIGDWLDELENKTR